MTVDPREWVGRQETAIDQITDASVKRLQATIDAEDVAEVPQGFHWCLAAPIAPTTRLEPDGHLPRGPFLPPVSLPRRMWAGSRVQFLRPLRRDDAVRRRSQIAAVTPKQGAGGALVFVDVEHATLAGGVEAVRERQTIVYRDAVAAVALPAVTAPDLSPWPWRRTVTPASTMLFRYSALTFNTHRIHYDLPYARDREGYPALVVHGPLIATLLLDLCARRLGPDALATFTFRAVSPAFAGQPLHLVGREAENGLELAALGGDGRIAMTATATQR